MAGSGDPGAQTLEQARWQVRVVLVVVGLFFLLVLLFSLVLFLPFSPMQVHAYEAQPDEVCPLDIVSVDVDYELAQAPRVTEIETQARWMAVDVDGVEKGQILEQEETPIRRPPLLAPGRREVTSVALRIAPLASGDWKVGAILTAHGERITQHQRLTPWATETTTVLPKTHPDCKEKA